MAARASSSASVGSDRVEISVPLRTEFFATLRTVAASLGADAGFSIDEIDDLRLAISEIVSSLADREGPDDRIEATFELSGDVVAVTITTDTRRSVIELDDLASSILGAVVDSYAVDGAQVTLVKSASEAAVTVADAEHTISEA